MPEQEVRHWIDAYMYAFSTSYRTRCGELRDAPGENHWQAVVACGSQAVQDLKRAGGESALQVGERLRRAPPPGDHNDEADCLRALLVRLGEPGWRELARCVDPSAPPTGDREAWRGYLRGMARELTNEDEMTDLDRLLWTQLGDHPARDRMVSKVDLALALRRQEPVFRPGVFDHDLLQLVTVLCVRPEDIDSAKLKAWASQSISCGVRWGADLALWARGDEQAHRRVLAITRNGFPLRPAEQRMYADAAPGLFARTQCEFVYAVAGLPLPATGKQDVLVGILSIADGRSAAARAASVYELQESWASLDETSQERVRESVAAAEDAETNGWARMVFVEFLSRHPRNQQSGATPP